MKSPLMILGKAVLIAVVLVVAQAIAGLLVPVRLAATPPAGWWLLSTFITACTLAVVAVRSSWRGWRAAVAVAVIPLAIQLANLTEAVFFLKKTALPFGPLVLSTVIAYALAVPALVLIFGRMAGLPAAGERRPAFTAGGSLWRFAAGAVSYLCLYYLAGLIVYNNFPQLPAFYQAQGTPPAAQIAGMQLLVRGPVFVALCILLTAMVRPSRARGVLAVGLAFTLLSGVAPLLMPNPFMPDAVRWVHFGEVGTSNFVLGAIVGWLWSRPVAAVARTADLPAAVAV